MILRRTLLLGLLLTAAPALRADTVELTPVADTCIADYFPSNNFGAMTFFNGGTTQNYATNRGLLRFDLAAVPAGSKILAAALTVEVVGQPGEPWNSANFGLHRLLQDWGEGDNFANKPQNAAAAGTNEANWFYRFAFTAATWGIPGGEPGVDYLPVPSATTWVYEAGLPYTFNSTSALAADVQAWLDEPRTNFGWMLIVQNATDNFTARRFGAREDALNAPRLTIDYTPFLIQNAAGVSNQFQFTVPVFAGRTTTVQFNDSLTSTNWQTLTNFPAPPADTNLVVADSLSATQRFYRLASP